MYVLFDIGASKMRIAVSEDLEKFGAPKIVDTPKDFKDGILLFKQTVYALAGDVPIKALAGGIAGPLDKNKTKLVNAPHLPGWVGKPLKSELSKIFGVPVFIENDSSIVGLGEAVYGPGKGHKVVAYLTISTGIGGCRVVGGRLDESAMGFEPGHQVVFCPNLPQKETPHYLEDCISGTSFEKRYKKKPYEVLDDKIWDEAAEILAHGLNNLVVFWSPDIVVLGGSMMKKIGIPVERVRFHLKNVLRIFPEPPVIKKAALGDIGGLYGSMVFLANHLKTSQRG